MKRIVLVVLALVAVGALVYGCVAYGHTAVRPDENPPAPHQYQVKHGVCTDYVHDGLPVRKCRVIVNGTEWETGYIGRHADPVAWVKKQVVFK
jgi:hypothetical protein